MPDVRVEVKDLGIIDYGVYLNLQETVAESKTVACEVVSVFFAEHPMVITLGRNPKGRLFKASNYEGIIKVSRGGSITAHFPGQLMLYVIFNMKAMGMGLKQWMQGLEDIVFDGLVELGLENIERRNRGLWIGNGKVASFGIGVKNWVTRFGCGLTYHLDNRVNDLIYPCGESGYFDSIDRYLGSISREELIRVLENQVKEFFGGVRCF